jgi:hypothetical protein
MTELRCCCDLPAAATAAAGAAVGCCQQKGWYHNRVCILCAYQLVSLSVISQVYLVDSGAGLTTFRRVQVADRQYAVC